jgi:hypothetical protein
MHTKKRALVLCPLPSDARGRPSRAARERDARAYWNRLSIAEEAWVLKAMKFAGMGRVA